MHGTIMGTIMGTTMNTNTNGRVNSARGPGKAVRGRGEGVRGAAEAAPGVQADVAEVLRGERVVGYRPCFACAFGGVAHRTRPGWRWLVLEVAVGDHRGDGADAPGDRDGPPPPVRPGGLVGGPSGPAGCVPALHPATCPTAPVLPVPDAPYQYVRMRQTGLAESAHLLQRVLQRRHKRRLRRRLRRGQGSFHLRFSSGKSRRRNGRKEGYRTCLWRRVRSTSTGLGRHGSRWRWRRPGAGGPTVPSRRITPSPILGSLSQDKSRRGHG